MIFQNWIEYEPIIKQQRFNIDMQNKLETEC